MSSCSMALSQDPTWSWKATLDNCIGQFLLKHIEFAMSPVACAPCGCVPDYQQKSTKLQKDNFLLNDYDIHQNKQHSSLQKIAI